MKIQKLNLVAFGPFTDKNLDFSQEEAGLHIIYGPNEAGKSSALRGLKALLYGVDVRTLDNFIHENKNLRINGCLRNADGHELEFTRRKGNKKTLLKSDGTELDDQKLTPFIQGVSADLFEMLFGIDHQALLRGGQEILEQKGEVGQALFSAAIGSHALHSVLKTLDDEASGLFLPQGTKPTINTALKSYKDLEKGIRAHSLSSSEWDSHHRAFAKANDDLIQVQSEISENSVEVNRLERIKRLLPKFAQRHTLLQELESLGTVVTLSDDFHERRQQAVEKLNAVQAILSKASPRLHGLKGDVDDLIIRQDLLDQSEYIEDIHSRLGEYRKALQERPVLEEEHQLLLTDAALLLKQVRSDIEMKDVEQLRPLFLNRQSITELGNKKALLESNVKQSESNQRKEQQRLEQARKEKCDLPEMVSAKVLSRAIAAARKLGDIDTDINTAQGEYDTLHKRCTDDLSSLTLWDGELDKLPGLSLPNRENINYFEQAYDKIEKDVQRLEEKQDENSDGLKDVLMHLDEVQRVGTVPTEEDLLSIRSERDGIWKLLRRQWVEGEDVSAETVGIEVEGVMPDIFEDRLSDADDLSDRLRREADRVLKIASLQAKQASMNKLLKELTPKSDSLSSKKSELDIEWQALWTPCDIVPRTPREMRSWLEETEKLRENVGKSGLLNQKINRLERIRKEHIKTLNQQLNEMGKPEIKSASLESVLIECEESVQYIDNVSHEHSVLEKEISDLESNIKLLAQEHLSASENLDLWEAEWHKLIESSSLQENLTPSEMQDVIENLREIFSKLSESAKLHIKITFLNEETKAFDDLVEKLVISVAPELEGSPVEDVVVQLHSSLLDNQKRQSQRKQIDDQIEKTDQEIQDSKATVDSMTEQLDTLCHEAKCKLHTELDVAERESVKYLQLKSDIESIERGILEDGEGSTVMDLEVEANGENQDELPSRIEEIKNKINDELEPKRITYAEMKGREEKELELMDGSDSAAVLADEAQSLAASINLHAEHYVRVKLAGRILRDEIERYRMENQGPLLERASECFKILTLGSFNALKTDYNENDEPMLVGVRSDGGRVDVEGMSSGTRDQLYLALRLASLEKYMDDSEPMPFIVDDILVEFDDKRSEAALIALSQLAKKTQVILFTHHSNIVAQAKKIEGVHIQEL